MTAFGLLILPIWLFVPFGEPVAIMLTLVLTVILAKRLRRQYSKFKPSGIEAEYLFVGGKCHGLTAHIDTNLGSMRLSKEKERYQKCMFEFGQKTVFVFVAVDYCFVVSPCS